MTVTAMKACSRCGAFKSLTEFSPSDRYKSGHRSHCLECNRQDSRRWRRENPEKLRESARASQLRARYGMTQQDFDAMLASQGGVCAICGADDPGNGRRWNVDHCHDTGTIRALLCAGCNIGIGHLGHDPARLHAAADYIESHARKATA